MFGKIYTCKSIRRAFATAIVEAHVDFAKLKLNPIEYNPLQHSAFKTTTNVYANPNAKNKEKSDWRVAFKYGHCSPPDKDQQDWMEEY